MSFSKFVTMKKIHDNLFEPSEQKLKSLLEHYKARRYIDAEKLSLSITREFPKHKLAWKVFAAVLKQNGKLNESIIACQKSIQLDPKDAEAHKNLGIILQEKGRLKDSEISFKKAIALEPGYFEAHGNLGSNLKEQGKFKDSELSFRQVIELKPDFAEAHINLGVLLQIQGRFKEAELSYKKAIELKSNYARAHNNLGVLLEKQGRLHEACFAFFQAINLNSHFADAFTNLGITLKNVRFNSSNTKLYPILIQLINADNFVRPSNIAPSILSLLEHDTIIKNLLIKKNSVTSLEEVNIIIKNLDKLTILHHLMRVCPLPDLRFERLFVNMRSLILNNLDNIVASSELIYFLSTLSLHCFTNEYVYVEKNKETEIIKNLETEISQNIEKSNQPQAKTVLCLASYRPLHQYDWCKKLKTLDNLKEVKSRLIDEPYAERAIMAEIPLLGEISDNVSRKVRAQYEQNPYPRWIKTRLDKKAKSISEACADINIHLHSESIKEVIAPSILVAGCGTGQHSIGMSAHFSKCQVTAVDLSLASLSYAKRKTADFGITNLKYLQADILKLDQLKEKFDIVDSVGVLHHMDEPMTGWKVLTNLLKPSGLMRIGLYSELARQEIVNIRKEIALKKVGTSESEIREYRQKLAESNEKDHQQLTKSSDFYSLSTLRDLIFHVQEHRFTIPQIKNCLEELGLKFCGFINKEAISNFRKLHGESADIYDLEKWNQFEQNNPQIFAGMYQFWCQKI